MSFSKIILSTISLDIERSHEQAYLKGAESLLKLADIVLENQEHSRLPS